MPPKEQQPSLAAQVRNDHACDGFARQRYRSPSFVCACASRRQMAIELQKNRELTRTLYTLRGEAPPNEHGYVPRHETFLKSP
jgi:hypothetical protein